MRDIYDAIELYSIVLFGRLRRMANDYGWAIKGYGWDQSRGERRFVKVHGSILPLPGGGAASFTPRSEPQNDKWYIDIRRVDGVVHSSWADGVYIRKVGSGYDLYYRVNVGFVTSGPEAERRGFRFDTAVRGNGNLGHLYGTQLVDAEKLALLEYLKTL